MQTQLNKDTLMCIHRDPSFVGRTDRKGMNLIHHLATAGKTRVITTVIQFCGNETINKKDNDGLTPIVMAVRAGRFGTVIALVHLGADITLCNEDKITLMHIAAKYCRPHIADYLLRLDANFVRAVDIFQRTPLHYAALNNSPSVILQLIRAGADINARSISGNTPLMDAVMYSSRNAIELLVKLGADVTLRNEQRRGVLHFAAAGRILSDVLRLLGDKVQTLREVGDFIGMKPYHIAVAHGVPAPMLCDDSPVPEVCCAICLGAPFAPIVTTCGHMFCRSCLYSALITTRQRSAQRMSRPFVGTCPLCRALISQPIGYEIDSVIEYYAKKSPDYTERPCDPMENAIRCVAALGAYVGRDRLTFDAQGLIAIDIHKRYTVNVWYVPSAAAFLVCTKLQMAAGNVNSLRMKQLPYDFYIYNGMIAIKRMVRLNRELDDYALLEPIVDGIVSICDELLGVHPIPHVKFLPRLVAMVRLGQGNDSYWPRLYVIEDQVNRELMTTVQIATSAYFVQLGDGLYLNISMDVVSDQERDRVCAVVNEKKNRLARDLW